MREQAEHATVGTKEAAKELNVLQATVSKLCREGKLPGQRKTKKEAPGEFPLSLFGREKSKGGFKQKKVTTVHASVAYLKTTYEYQPGKHVGHGGKTGGESKSN